VILDEAEALLDPVSDIDGFMLACLMDASTGMLGIVRARLLQAAENHGLQLGGGIHASRRSPDIRPSPSLAGELLPRSRGRDGRCRPPRLDHRGNLAAHAHRHHPPRLT